MHSVLLRLGEFQLHSYGVCLALGILLLLQGNVPGQGETAAVKTKQILETWLCPGEEAPVRAAPKADSDVLWTLDMDRYYRTDQHVDQYYALQDENGRTGKKDVYAGGDAVTGAATVILAMGAGKKAAASILEDHP